MHPATSFRLAPTPAQREAIEATLAAFAAACAHVARAGTAEGTSSNAVLHRLCYREVRARYELSANLAVRAIARAAAALKGTGANRASEPAPLLTFPPDRLHLDARVFSVGEGGGTVSLSTVHGRLQDVRVAPPAVSPRNVSSSTGREGLPLRSPPRLLRAVLRREGDAYAVEVEWAWDSSAAADRAIEGVLTEGDTPGLDSETASGSHGIPGAGGFPPASGGSPPTPSAGYAVR